MREISLKGNGRGKPEEKREPPAYKDKDPVPYTQPAEPPELPEAYEK